MGALSTTSLNDSQIDKNSNNYIRSIKRGEQVEPGKSWLYKI